MWVDLISSDFFPTYFHFESDPSSCAPKAGPFIALLLGVCCAMCGILLIQFTAFIQVEIRTQGCCETSVQGFLCFFGHFKTLQALSPLTQAAFSVTVGESLRKAVVSIIPGGRVSGGLSCCPNGCSVAVLVLPPLQLELLVVIAVSWRVGPCSQTSAATDAFPVLSHPPLGGRGWMKQAGLSGSGLY